jgi:hypothetical protein
MCLTQSAGVGCNSDIRAFDLRNSKALLTAR